MQYSRRLRINVSTTSRGIKSYDCTVNVERVCEDGELGPSAAQERAEILAESDALVAELDKRYPAEA